MRRVVSMLLQNEAGALARVAGMFSARGFNIYSLTVAPTHDAAVSRLTLVTFGDESVLDQIVKQSRKLVDVIDVADLTSRDYLECELLIVKVGVRPGQAPLIAACVRRHPRAVLFDESDGTRTIQFAGSHQEIDACLTELESVAEILELARTGTAALDRGEVTLAIAATA